MKPTPTPKRSTTNVTDDVDISFGEWLLICCEAGDRLTYSLTKMGRIALRNERTKVVYILPPEPEQ